MPGRVRVWPTPLLLLLLLLAPRESPGVSDSPRLSVASAAWPTSCTQERELLPECERVQVHTRTQFLSLSQHCTYFVHNQLKKKKKVWRLGVKQHWMWRRKGARAVCLQQQRGKKLV